MIFTNRPFNLLDGFIRVCKWLQKKRSFFWSALILGLGLNILASLLLTTWPWIITLKQTPIGWAFQNPYFILFIGIILLLTDSIIYLGSLVSTNSSDKELKRYYLTRMINETKMLTLKGIPAGLISESVPIDEVFIPLMFRPNRPRADYPLTDKELDYYRNCIMSGIFPEDLDRVIIEAEHNWQHTLKENQRISFDRIWKQLTPEYPAAVIQGYPGMGKSTLMERLTLHLARRGLKLDDPNMSEPVELRNSVELSNSFNIISKSITMIVGTQPGLIYPTLNSDRISESLFWRMGVGLESKTDTQRLKLNTNINKIVIPLSRFGHAFSKKVYSLVNVSRPIIGRRKTSLVSYDTPSSLYSGPSLIPILLRLGEYASERAKVSNLSLFEYLTTIIDSFQIPGLSKFIHRSLSAGCCLVMLDGLDEVSDPLMRIEVQEEIKTFIRAHCDIQGEMYNKFLITSRVAGYDQGAFPDYLHYTVAELSQQQIHYFLPRWCRVNVRHHFDLSTNDEGEREEVTAKEIERRVKELIEAVENNQGVRELAENPLLLSLLAVMQQNSIELPRQRVELYSVVTRTLLENRNIAKKLDPIPEVQAIQRLGPIAFQMQDKKNSFIRTTDVLDLLVQTIGLAGGTREDILEEAERFLKRIRERGGLFVQRTGDYFGFLHRTFQEYFAARYMLNQIKLKQNDAIVELTSKAHRSDALWREPFLLAVAYQSNENEQVASEIIHILLNETLDSDEASRLRDLLLASQCLIESKPLTIDARLENQITLRLLQAYEKAQWSESFEICEQIEDAICRWLLSLPREAYRPPILATLQAIITDSSQVSLQSATLALLGIITNVLVDRHSKVIDAFIPILLSLADLPDMGKYKPIKLQREADPYIADLAIIVLSQMIKQELLADVRSYFKNHPDHLRLLAYHSLKCNILFNPAIISYQPEYELEEAYRRWFKLHSDQITNMELEGKVDACLSIYEDMLNHAQEIRYPGFLYLVRMLQFSRIHFDENLLNKWKDYLMKQLDTKQYINFQEIAILWIMLFPNIVDLKSLAVSIKEYYIQNDGLRQSNAKRFMAAIANRMRHEPSSLYRIRSQSFRTPRDLLYLRNMHVMEDLRGIRELGSLQNFLLTREVAEKTVELVSHATQSSHLDLISLIDFFTIILGRVLQICKVNEHGTAIERELQQFVLSACNTFPLVEDKAICEAILDIIRYSPARTHKEIKYLLQLAEEVFDEQIQQACAFAIERAKPITSEAWIVLESGKQSNVKAISAAVETALKHKEQATTK